MALLEKTRARSSSAGAQGTRKTERRLATGLGAFSVGLGLVEVLAPRILARIAGVPPRTGVLRLFGLREIAAGALLFGVPVPAIGFWSRVAGDALDIAALGASLASGRARPARIPFAGAAVLGATALDVYAAVKATRRPTRRKVRSMAINRSPDECAAYWRDADLPELLRSCEVVQFSPRPGGRGAILRVVVRTALPKLAVKEALRSFKRFVETGEVPTTEGQPSGRTGGRS